MRVKTLVTWLLALSSVAACAPGASPSGSGVDTVAPASLAAPKNIVAITSGNPPGLDNRFVVTSNNANSVAVPLYASPLIISDVSAAISAPVLAEAIPSLANGLWKVAADNTMETQLSIKPGTRWHDGVAVTTGDILFAEEVYEDNNLPHLVDSAHAYIDHMTAIDDRTLAIQWKQPYIMADAFSPDLLPAHLLQQVFSENDQALTTSAWLSDAYVGTGPFKLKHFEASAYMTLSAFDGYVLGRPRVDEVQLLFMPDANTMLANMLSGAADISLSSSPSVEQAAQLQNQSWDGQVGTFSMNWIHFFVQYIDPVHPVLTDKRFHKGLMLSQDRQAFVDGIQHGWGGVAEMPLLPTDPNFQTILSEVDRYPYDPRRAAELFREAGLEKDSDGFLHFISTGQKLDPIEFRTTGEQDVQVRLLSAMSDYFKAVGLDINQVIIPQAHSSDRVYRVTNPGFEELSGGLGPAFLIGWMHSSKVPTPENHYTSGNYPRYANPEWDALIDRYAVTIPQDARLGVETEIVRFLMDNLMDVGIIYSTHPQFASKRMIVPDTRALWSPQTWDVRS